jgi:pSer/pThr/pTyr-binding forkhead associated (FHA) protein/outer membrane biosynthesis protein TonB
LKSPIILRIFKDNQLIEVKQFESDQIIFGHDADVTVDLNDETVSAVHCLIELRDSGYYLCDMGSSSGTKKNGQVVLDEPISSGDNIEIGPFRVQFFVGAPKPKVAPLSVAPAAAVAPPPTAPESPKAPVAPKVPSAPVAPPAPAASKPVAKQAAPPIPAAPLPKPPSAPPPSSNKAGASPSKPAAPVNQGRPPILPDSTVTESISYSKASRHEKTFAPASEIEDLGSYLKPTKGPVIEVIVAWQERILSTHHFGGDQNATIGTSAKADVFIPGFFTQGVAPFLELKGGCRVLAPLEMEVDLTHSSQGQFDLAAMMKTGKAMKAGTVNAIRLDQGELLKLTVGNGTIQIFVRYVSNTIKPLLAPPLDFSAGELTGLIVSMVIVSLTALYMSVYTPPAKEDEKPEEQVRLAQFIYNKPPTTTMAAPEPTMPKKEVEVKPPPPVEPKKIKVTEEKKEAVQKGKKEATATAKQVEAAKASEVRPNNNVNRPKKFTSIKQGGATKIGDTAGANAQSNKDVSKVGLLSAFGGGGVRKQLDQAYSGSGELLGMANEATGKSGQNEDRSGDDIGSKFKDTGAGGKGTATQGIAGIGTKGRGSGMSSYGSGVGLGGKGNVTIDAGGEDAGWEGTIDREAVRRVIRSILNQIKSCYERQLRVNSSLEGKVVIQFEIMEQGRVRSAKTKTTSLNDNTVESCVAARIREARFPEPPSGTIAVVDYPFVFGAQK